MITPRLRWAGVAIAALLFASCGYDQTVVPEPEAAPAASAPAASTPPACDNALQSYAPTGTAPTTDTLPPRSTMATIKQRGRLIAGVSADTYLLGSRNPINGQVEGFDIDIVKQVAKAIFGDETKYQLRVITAAERLPVLEAGEVDIVVRNMTINCARWQDIAFSAEYYRSGQKVLVRRDLATTITGVDQLGETKVCAPAGTSSFDNLVKAAPDATVVTAPNHTGCLVKFQQGEVDAISGDDTVLAGLAAQDPYAVVPQQEAFSEEPYGVGVNQGQVDLVQFVNAVLERMRTDGSWAESYKKWLQPTLGAGTGQPQPTYGRTQ